MKKLIITLNVSLSQLYSSKQVSFEEDDIHDTHSQIKEDEESGEEPPQAILVLSQIYI